MKVFPRFSCTLCGECCSGTMKVFLNSYDLYKIGKFLNLRHTKELFEKNLVEWAVGQNGLELPKIRFKTYPFSFCPFLVNDFQEGKGLRGLCSLHPEHKPLVCHLSPLTRLIDLEEKTDSFDFVPPHPACPGCGQGKPIKEDVLREECQEELDLELRYYEALAAAAEKGPEAVKSLFLFSLEGPYILLPGRPVNLTKETAVTAKGLNGDCRGK